MLKTKVKASSITNLTDARYFAAWEVEWLGFNLDANAEDYINPVTAKAIKEWVDGVKIVGEFGLADANAILDTANAMELDAIQLGPFADVATANALAGQALLKEFIIDQETNPNALAVVLAAFAPYCQTFILNFDKNGISWSDLQKGTAFTVAHLQQLCEEYPILVSIKVESSQLNNLLETIRPLGLNVIGGEEEAVGVKSFDELDDLFETIEILI